MLQSEMLTLMRQMQDKINKLEAKQTLGSPMRPQQPSAMSSFGYDTGASTSALNTSHSVGQLPGFNELFGSSTPTTGRQHQLNIASLSTVPQYTPASTTAKQSDMDFITTLSGRSVVKRNYGENDDEG